MKTLADQTLIYDKDCPLCRAYSHAFVQTGMLGANGKMAYSELESCAFVDMDRAANEIALVDFSNRTTIYGIDSLLRVIGNSFPVVEKIGKIPPIHYALIRFYRLISYNRKVIMPNPKQQSAGNACVPDFNLTYRIFYMILATLVSALLLQSYWKLLPAAGFAGFWPEIAIVAGQVLFQTLFIANKDWRTVVNYAGNLLTISLFGALLLIPMLIASHYFQIHAFTAATYMMLVICIMFIEHFRRVDLLQLPKLLCATWVAYRVLLIMFIS